MTTLPRRVKVGPFVYTIERWDVADARDKREFGNCDPALHVIKIDTQYSDSIVANTLLHEILHAVWNAWGLGDSEEEEKAVNNLANGLQAVFNDNPAIRNYFLGGE